LKIRAGVPEAAAAIAIALLAWWLATPYGLGVSPDSTQYLSAAQNLADGRGLVVHWWARGVVPLTHFPPLVPVAIGSLVSAGFELARAAQVMNGIALAVTVWITFLMTQRSTGSVFAPFCAALAVALSRDVLEVHAMVWSEPLYTVLSMTALFLVIRLLRDDQWWILALAAIVAGLTIITRYVGIALVGTCGLSILLFAQGPFRRRFLRAAAFGVVALLPVIALFARNLGRSGNVANRELAFHPVELRQLRSAASTVYHWLTPRTLNRWELPVMLLLGGGVLLYSLVWVRTTREKGTRDVPGATDVMRVLVTYVVCYFAFLCLTITVADAQTDFGPRLLAPLIPPCIVIAADFLWASAQHPIRRRATVVLLAVVALGLVTSLYDWIRPVRAAGLGYNSTPWRRSQLAALVRRLPPDVDLYSNYPDALLYLTGREVTGLPRIFSPTSLKPNRQYDRQVRAMSASAASQRVAIAYFLKFDQEAFIPSIAQVRRRLASHPSRVVADGVLDTVPQTCATRMPADSVSASDSVPPR
jgi:hypothetical protein